MITLTEKVDDETFFRKREHFWADKLGFLLICLVTVTIHLFLCSFIYILLLFTLTNNYIFYKNYFYLPKFCIAYFGNFFWYPSLAKDDTSLIICHGHYLTMVTKVKGMEFLLLNDQSISLVKSTIAGIK